MKVTILTENIENYFPLLTKSLPSRTQIPILSNILLVADKNGLLVKATDLELGVELRIPAKIESEGAVTVPGKEFLEVLSSLPKDKVTLEKIKDTLVVICRSSKVVFNTIAMEEFPELYKNRGEEVIRFGRDEFVDIFSYLIFAVSSEETRPQLTGIYINKNDEKIDFVATDGYRMSIKRVGVGKKNLSAGLIISVKLINEVMSLKNEKEEVVLRVNSSENQIFFEVGEVLLVGRMIEGRFPDYNKVVPKEGKTVIVVDREELLQNVKLVSVFAKDQSSIVMVEATDGALHLSTRTSGVGEGDVVVDCQKTGDDVKISFNARFLQEFLRTVGEKNITLKLNSSLEPALFELSEKDFIHIIMPIQAED